MGHSRVYTSTRAQQPYIKKTHSEPLDQNFYQDPDRVALTDGDQPSEHVWQTREGFIHREDEQTKVSHDVEVSEFCSEPRRESTNPPSMYQNQQNRFVTSPSCSGSLDQDTWHVTWDHFCHLGLGVSDVSRPSVSAGGGDDDRTGPLVLKCCCEAGWVQTSRWAAILLSHSCVVSGARGPRPWCSSVTQVSTDSPRVLFWWFGFSGPVCAGLFVVCSLAVVLTGPSASCWTFFQRRSRETSVDGSGLITCSLSGVSLQLQSGSAACYKYTDISGWRRVLMDR